MEPSTPPAATPTGAPGRPLELSTERSSSDSTIAPASLSPNATAIATQAQLGRGAPPPVPTTPRSVRDSASFTTANLPSSNPSASLALPSSSQPRSHAVSETTDNASLLSEEGELSDNYYDGYYVDRDRDKAARGATGSSGNYSATSNSRGNKGKKVNISKSGAQASRGKGRSRNTTGTRERDQEDVDEDDEEEPVGRDRAMSPGLSLLSAGRTTTFDDDDEVERRDRGEELVRKRMRDRARIKKEAEKAARRRDVEGRGGSRAIQPYSQQRQSHHPTASDVEGEDVRSRSVSVSQSYGDRGRIPLVRRNTEGESQSQSRVASTNHNRESFATSVGSQGGYFDDATSMDGTERGVLSVPTSPLALSSSNASALFAPLSPSIGHGASILRGVSHSESIHEEEEQSESGHTLKSVGEEVDDQAYDGAGDDVSAGDEDDIDEDDDDDEEGDGEVEYTLKDRQDAINIEHPFGLPIWKPALYKKSRSVTRNAETAVHANPTSTTLNHFAPPNVMWTIFFGSWLALICVIVSGVLWCTPWGGEKYGRVLWELGGYLFWPFGKYVEGWSDAVDGDGEENGDAEETDDEDEERRTLQHRDVEDAGKTYGRGRARLSSSHSATSPQPTTVQELFAPADAHDLPDEPRRRSTTQDSDLTPPTERTGLVRQSTTIIYGAVPEEAKLNRSSSESTVTARRSGSNLHDFNKDNEHSYRVRALGRTMYWVGFYLIIGPLMLTVCILCWGLVFTVPMAKLLWVLLRHLSNEPLSLHFRSPPKYSPPTGDKATDENPQEGGIQYPLKAGQRAPPVSRRSVAVAKAQGRIFGPSSTVLLCTYQAAGLQYYKYTVDGVNILFINLLSLVFFVIADDWYIAPYIHAHPSSLFLQFIAGKGFIFVMALLSVIPLSYFIGMAVASISAQSSIGMGAVINASFGSIIEIILYCIALTQSKADLVEGSIVGSILAAVLLMPGLSMIGGAMRRKEQKFNAKSAGVTSTMLIMAIIGILTPTLFYEIYGSFQLNCTGCAPNVPGGTTSSCKSCFYEHVDPVDDPFYKNTVVWLSYYCAIILVLSYLVGLWFSLRTHASQIWQNAQSTHELPSHTRPLTVHQAHPALTKRQTLIGGALPQVLHVKRSSTPARHSSYVLRRPSASDLHPPTQDDIAHHRSQQALRSSSVVPPPPAMTRSVSHAREHSGATVKKIAGEEEEDGAGGHDAPNWSRVKSASVLMSCTILYAIIAEILVDVVDVVLDGSGIPEKLLGVTLFALVPNTTEFMNAISFAINGNIALSMEIGSAYALQVCLIQAPAMLAFTAFYSIGKISMEHKAFTLVFPRWDVIAIIFSVFLLTYTYIEARANYYRGTILCLSYLVLLGGFVFAPGDRDTEDNPIFTLAESSILPTFGALQTTFLSLFAK